MAKKVGPGRFTEFECPECNAHNPHDESFGNGDEIICHYCGMRYVVEVVDERRYKLKEA